MFRNKSDLPPPVETPPENYGVLHDTVMAIVEDFCKCENDNYRKVYHQTLREVVYEKTNDNASLLIERVPTSIYSTCPNPIYIMFLINNKLNDLITIPIKVFSVSYNKLLVAMEKTDKITKDYNDAITHDKILEAFPELKKVK